MTGKTRVRFALAALAVTAVASVLQSEAITTGPRAVKSGTRLVGAAARRVLDTAARQARPATAAGRLGTPAGSTPPGAVSPPVWASEKVPQRESLASRVSSLAGGTSQQHFVNPEGGDTGGEDDTGLVDQNEAGDPSRGPGGPKDINAALAGTPAGMYAGSNSNLTPEEKRGLLKFEQKYSRVRKQALMAGQHLNNDRDSRGRLRRGAVGRAVKYANDNYTD
ncbi:hypothetical protein BESB_035900 [Besnoitia besnoiti]|uniref:Uncharacterized protein n=1 Tax=Besnoitia besnoiti TaxID=94643 RepID=A0A2A9MNB3_BESBE|nr:hypothetical protein BESB_035900 [Besnoitia besnoiti]PFH37132.1 hypothetical protein BESB_035900 [Besnoitia besnoiti]